MAIITVFPGTNAIQNAVNVAEPGDVILVNKGVYNEEVSINTSNIRIVSASNKVFLDGNNTLVDAFTLAGVTGVEINGFRIANYIGDGITLVVNSSFNLITGNTITNIGEDGIDINAGSGNLILANHIEDIGNDSDDSGIELDGNANWVVNNTIKGNSGAGILVRSSDNGVIGNFVHNNNGSGFEVQTDFNVFEKNQVTRNKNNGIILTAAAEDNSIFKNLFSNNLPSNIVNNGIDNNFLKNKLNNK